MQSARQAAFTVRWRQHSVVRHSRDWKHQQHSYFICLRLKERPSIRASGPRAPGVRKTSSLGPIRRHYPLMSFCYQRLCVLKSKPLQSHTGDCGLYSFMLHILLNCMLFSFLFGFFFLSTSEIFTTCFVGRISEWMRMTGQLGYLDTLLKKKKEKKELFRQSVDMPGSA